ncbi:MAG: DUF6788 family protein [Gemmatimonadales bacterium]
MPRPLPTTPAGRRVLARIRAIRPFLEGSLTITTKRCGNPRCRCAEAGPIHETALLTWKERTKTCTLHVPLTLRAEVTAWVDEAKRLKQLIHAMSEAQRTYLIRRRTQHARGATADGPPRGPASQLRRSGVRGARRRAGRDPARHRGVPR